ncbi:MAG TPA: SpoIIE family protein phosphatase [Candidatus Baltobacteraceae bacterium]|nr:SpoIIE family protein phosphatase [Candidatus Baltobacteraceae bacterium]
MQLQPEWIEAAETLPIVIWTARADGGIEYINRRWEEATGVNGERVLGTGWMAFVHPDDLEKAALAYSNAIAAGTPLHIEVRIQTIDGSYRWVRAETEAMRDEDGNIVRWFGIVLDVDEVHRAQERSRVLGEAVPVMVWTADADGWVDWYNGRWYEYTGQTPKEARGWGWQAAHHPEDFLEFMRRWPHSIQTGEPCEMEFRLRRHDGVYNWFLTRINPLRDESGKIIRWYGSNMNIDAQKTALERSKRIAETLQDVFLPKTLPHLSDVRFDSTYIAAEKDALIGGDWFDAFELPDGRIGFSIGDVAGHGLEASVLVGRLRQAIFTLGFQNDDPAAILAGTNSILQYQNPETFVTAIVGFINREHDELTYSIAGHPPPLVAGPNDAMAHALPSGGPPLGVLSNPHYTNHTVAMEQNSVVVLYTDGMTEFARDILSGETKLMAAASLFARNTSIARPARAIQELVLNDAPATDDAAVMVIQFSTVEPVPVHLDPASLERRWRFHSSDAFSAHAARRQIVAYLQQFVAESSDVFVAELIAGELLANTVEHAPGLVEICIDWSAEKPVMSVRDAGPGIPGLTNVLPSNALDENGRGLYLVQALAEDVAVKGSAGYGTEIRVTLPLRRKAATNSHL